MTARQEELIGTTCKGCKRAVYTIHLDRDGYCSQADGSPCPNKPAPTPKPRVETTHLG